MELRIRGTEQERLLFQLIGIGESTDGSNGSVPCALLLGADEPDPEQELLPCLRLPDPAHPSHETEQLTRMLGRAIGLGEVRL